MVLCKTDRCDGKQQESRRYTGWLKVSGRDGHAGHEVNAASVQQLATNICQALGSEAKHMRGYDIVFRQGSRDDVLQMDSPETQVEVRVERKSLDGKEISGFFGAFELALEGIRKTA
jgi:hypothetical protein